MSLGLQFSDTLLSLLPVQLQCVAYRTSSHLTVLPTALPSSSLVSAPSSRPLLSLSSRPRSRSLSSHVAAPPSSRPLSSRRTTVLPSSHVAAPSRPLVSRRSTVLPSSPLTSQHRLRHMRPGRRLPPVSGCRCRPRPARYALVPPRPRSRPTHYHQPRRPHDTMTSELTGRDVTVAPDDDVIMSPDTERLR